MDIDNYIELAEQMRSELPRTKFLETQWGEIKKKIKKTYYNNRKFIQNRIAEEKIVGNFEALFSMQKYLSYPDPFSKKMIPKILFLIFSSHSLELVLFALNFVMKLNKRYNRILEKNNWNQILYNLLQTNNLFLKVQTIKLIGIYGQKKNNFPFKEFPVICPILSLIQSHQVQKEYLATSVDVLSMLTDHLINQDDRNQIKTIMSAYSELLKISVEKNIIESMCKWFVRIITEFSIELASEIQNVVFSLRENIQSQNLLPYLRVFGYFFKYSNDKILSSFREIQRNGKN